MIDLWEEPHSETDGDYVVFFGNLMGSAHIITIMRKDKADVAPHYACMMVAFIHVPIPGGDPKFSWHDNVKELDEKPFTQEWVVEQYTRQRWLAFHDDGVDYHGKHDAELILQHGIDGLNFVPSTPPEHR